MSDEMDGAVDDLYDEIRDLKAGIQAVRILVEQGGAKEPILSLLDTMLKNWEP